MLQRWIGVDLDGTLAIEGPPYTLSIGKPILPMIDKIKVWLSEGIEVKIFTARVSATRNGVTPAENRRMIQDWLEIQGLPRLRVTAVKDFGLINLYDDRAYRVERNTGKIL